MTSQHFAGRFSCTDAGDGVVRLYTGAPTGIEICFTGVSRHDLPAALTDIHIQADGSQPAAGRFVLNSAGQRYSIAARAVQIHEAVDLYGSAIRLPRLSYWRRWRWSILLRIAGSRYGQSLINLLVKPRSSR